MFPFVSFTLFNLLLKMRSDDLITSSKQMQAFTRKVLRTARATHSALNNNIYRDNSGAQKVIIHECLWMNGSYSLDSFNLAFLNP